MNSEPLDTRVVNGRYIGHAAPANNELMIHNGRVIQAATEEVWRTVNASGHLVLPGLIQPAGIDRETALTAVRNGVTTAIAPAIARQEACLDWIAHCEPDILTVEVTGAGLLADSDWELLAGDGPVYLRASERAEFPIIHFLYHEGHIKRSIPLDRIADVASGCVARELGVFPRKGSFAPESDGDLVVFDPDGDDPYSEQPWPGRVIFSLQRGNILLFNGQIHTGAADGRRVG